MIWSICVTGKKKQALASRIRFQLEIWQNMNAGSGCDSMRKTKCSSLSWWITMSGGNSSEGKAECWQDQASPGSPSEFR